MKQGGWNEKRIWLSAFGVASVVALLRWAGLFQSLELGAIDQLFRLRPAEPPDHRIAIIGIDDTDIDHMRQWPLSDQRMAELIQKVQSYQPRVIGLDIYRDFPVGEGNELQQVFETTPNLIGIEKIEDEESVGVKPPAILAERNQIGFNNVVVDDDGRVRRALLFWAVNGRNHRSFALRLALAYLKVEGITPKNAITQPSYLQLGQAVFEPLQPNDGGYVRADTGGYQILANLRNPHVSTLHPHQVQTGQMDATSILSPTPPHRLQSPFQVLPMRDVLAGEIDPALLHDRIVLIGSTAASLKDLLYTSYSGGVAGNAQPIYGVEIHAHFISQIISAAMDGRSLIRVTPKPFDLLWIFGWSWLGFYLSWRMRSLLLSGTSIVIGSGGLLGMGYGVFLLGWWIPLVPPLAAFVGSAVLATSYLAYQEEELKKSKEFLSSVINTIPDPIFVKDRNHRWIVLNEAYSRFAGYPLEQLLNKSDLDIFPDDQAIHFLKQDELVLKRGTEQETEEEFTSADGVTYAVATKRSLHKDAAGNVFLVGVIRDITQRKRMEEDLRRTADELVRSNKELLLAKDQLSRMAYYDPLTKLPNRQRFHESLMQAIELAQTHDRLVALLFLDLDGFKQINDTFGHDMGNLLLKAVAQRLTRCLRGSDTVARWGGDEFVVLLPSIPTMQDISKVAQKILDTLANQFILEGQTIPISTSIGISIYPTDTTDPDLLLKKADLAMYQAKGAGKNRYEFANPEDAEANIPSS